VNCCRLTEPTAGRWQVLEFVGTGLLACLVGQTFSLLKPVTGRRTSARRMAEGKSIFPFLIDYY